MIIMLLAILEALEKYPQKIVFTGYILKNSGAVIGLKLFEEYWYRPKKNSPFAESNHYSNIRL